MKKVFLHGLGQTPASWKNTVERLQDPESCICIDMTKAPGGPLTYSGLYSEVCKTLDALEPPFALCGLSLGGVLALNYAAEHPEKTGALVLVAAQYKMPKNLLKFQNFLFHCMPKTAFDSAGFTKSDAITLCQTMQPLDFSNVLGDISCPALIICGEKDRSNIKAAKEMSEKIKSGRLVILKNCGHEINAEAPEKLAEIIGNFGL